MGRKFKRHHRSPLIIKKPKVKENLHSQKGSIPLNKAQEDRISFSILKNDKNQVRKIENISYEINIEGKWEEVVRYDDHGGQGFRHRHHRVSLQDKREVESTIGIKKYRDKKHALTWVCNEIKRNYLAFRMKFRKNSKLDLY